MDNQMNKQKINFDELPRDIKELIFKKNRTSNNIINRDKKLAEFWDKWSEDYEDDLEEFYDEGDISSWDWEQLTINEKINIYKRHQRLIQFNESVLCDGSAPDWWYELEPESDEDL